MNTLSPMERRARKTLVFFLVFVGFSITSVARIMNMHQSTVSRMAVGMPKTWRPDKDLFLAEFDE